IAVPSHDRGDVTAANILRMTGSPHRVTVARLDTAHAAWTERLSPISVPRIAVLVGGATKAFPFTEARATELGRSVAALAAMLGGRVMLTTSRRTGRGAEAALLSELPGSVWAYRWGDAGENPYFGLLAWADIVVVTGDSMSMVSEACGTEKPVLIDAPAAETSAKHARFHAELIASRRALRLSEDAVGLSKAISGLDTTPINAATDIAAALQARGLV
ncbi:MAG: mitochondrial fission ELM1 family protein, partial [Rhodospirillaceae bacterium]|nr:mitochondrial fission ELM1 family protein [Rhodospirillaceae bacterium]